MQIFLALSWHPLALLSSMIDFDFQRLYVFYHRLPQVHHFLHRFYMDLHIARSSNMEGKIGWLPKLRKKNVQLIATLIALFVANSANAKSDSILQDIPRHTASRNSPLPESQIVAVNGLAALPMDRQPTLPAPHEGTLSSPSTFPKNRDTRTIHFCSPTLHTRADGLY